MPCLSFCDGLFHKAGSLILSYVTGFPCLLTLCSIPRTVYTQWQCSHEQQRLHSHLHAIYGLEYWLQFLEIAQNLEQGPPNM